MPGLGISEFEDALWDEFFRVDDHMVPDDGLECPDDHFPRHDSMKNSLCEGSFYSSNSQNGSVSRYDNLGGEQGRCSISRDRYSAMSETDSWSCKQTVVFPFTYESDLIEETPSVAFEDNRSSCRAFKINDTDCKGGEFSVNGTNLCDKSTPVDHFSDITHQGSSSFENIDSSDFFSDALSDIRSFEDVEWMLRSPDSAFGVGVNKEDELRWLSSVNDKGGLKSLSSCPKSSMDEIISEENDSSKSYLGDDSPLASEPIKFKDSSFTLEKSDSVISFVDEPGMADSDDGFVPRDEIHEHKKQFKPLNHPKGIRKGHNSGKCSSRYLSDLPIEVILPSGAASYEEFPSAHFKRKRKQALDLRHQNSNVPLNNSHLSDQTSVNQSPSAVKYKGTDSTFLSLMEFSNEPGQLKFIKSSNDLPSPVTSLAGIDKLETEHNNQVGKQFKDPVDADGVGLLNPAESGSSIVRESSTLSLYDIYPEAASFCQLQLAMEWLDFRTRLCIRDGLYRLARGAEQRHNHANLCGNSGDIKTSSGILIAEGTDKCTNFMNMETGTNPIDRSIAHLLFHRPPDSCAIPAHDS